MCDLTLLEHFARLDTDRERDEIGPKIGVELLWPWTCEPPQEQPWIRRERRSLYVCVNADPEEGCDDDPVRFPIFRLPVTMRGEFVGRVILTDHQMHLVAEEDGLVYVDPIT